jgi:hypothetical protein
LGGGEQMETETKQKQKYEPPIVEKYAMYFNFPPSKVATMALAVKRRMEIEGERQKDKQSPPRGLA